MAMDGRQWIIETESLIPIDNSRQDLVWGSPKRITRFPRLDRDYELRAAGFSTSSHHCRKLVGEVDLRVRASALSRPSFLATIISSMACARGSGLFDPITLSLN